MDSLNRMHARLKDKLTQNDYYFSMPPSCTAEKGSIIRLREEKKESGEKRTVLSYKSPNVLKKGVETREEIEVEVRSDVPTLIRLLDKIDVKPLVSVAKKRVEYSLTYKGVDFTVTLDKVSSLGSFVEIELMSSNKNDVQRLIALGEELATKLNIDFSKKISLGYHDLMLAKRDK
jgi:predicted adenylyl cyclase CyaB